jgi:hypothetical protein
MLHLAMHFVEHYQSAKNRTQNTRFSPRAMKMKESVGGELTRASRTSITRSASLRRSRMAREAAAMWPGNQLTTPPPALKAISPARFAARVSPLILGTGQTGSPPRGRRRSGQVRSTGDTKLVD